MRLEDLPEGGTPDKEIQRLEFYQRERLREKQEAERIYEKIRKGEPTSEAEDIYWAYSRYGSANSHNY